MRIKVNKSGEFILNHLYKHKKSINQIRKEEISKTTDESSVNKVEQGDINIGEEELIDKLNHVMTQEENESIRKSLSNHFVFKDITEDVLNLVMNELIYCAFSKGTIVYQEEEKAKTKEETFKTLICECPGEYVMILVKDQLKICTLNGDIIGKTKQ